MMPAAVQEIMGRIAELQQAPASVAQFVGALSQQVTASTSSGGAAPAGTTSTGTSGSAAPDAATSPAGTSDTTTTTARVSALRAVTPGVASAATPRRGALPSAATPWLSAITKAAKKAGIDPDLLTSLVWVESSFQPDAVSKVGAIGLAQLMPGTAKGLGVDPHDPAQNLDGAARMLSGLITQFGRVDHALAAYNVGPNGLVRGLAEGQTPGADYARAVADKYRTITGKELFA